MGSSGGSSGGGSPNAAKVRKFPFAFNTPGILTGATLYTPTVGDVLLDAWIEITTAWDGTTPLCDVGTFTSVGANGLFFEVGNGAIDLTQVDAAPSANAGLIIQGGSLTTSEDLAGSVISAVANARWTVGGSGQVQRAIAKFTVANPLKVCVSQDGSITGASPGSSVGAGVVYLVTATPA